MRFQKKNELNPTICSKVMKFLRHRAWYEMTSIKYVIVGSSVFYNVVAIFTYVVIFWKYVRSKVRVRHSNDPNDGQQRVSTVEVFVKSRFYVSVLIILTYLIFNTIPYCVHAILYPNSWTTNYRPVQFIMIVLHHLGYLSDPVIYIFLQRDVRKQLSKLMICKVDSTEDQVDNNGISDAATDLPVEVVASRIV